MRLRERKNRKKESATRIIARSSVKKHRYSLRQRKIDEFWIRDACQPSLLTLPCELQLIILNHLGPTELDAVRQVCTHFAQLVQDPTLWKEYEILDRKLETSQVIGNLKRMPLLKKMRIDNRNDCDRILRQISVSNKKLEQIHITNCTGSLHSLYLKPGYLTRMLERCRRLHTVCFSDTIFRGLKFYRLLGDALPRLRIFRSSITRNQLETLIDRIGQLSEKDRELIGTLCSYVPPQSWLPIRYLATGNPQQSKILYMGFRVADLTSNSLMCFIQPQ